MTELNKPSTTPAVTNEAPISSMGINNEPPSLNRSFVQVLPERLRPPSPQSRTKHATKKTGSIPKKGVSTAKTAKHVSIKRLSLESLGYLPPLNSAETSLGTEGQPGKRPRRRAQRRNSFVIHRKRNGTMLLPPFGDQDFAAISGSQEVASSLEVLRAALTEPVPPPPQAADEQAQGSTASLPSVVDAAK